MIYLASDHAGFKLKEHVKKFLKEMSLEYEDVGPSEFNESDDYPDFVIPAAEKVAAEKGKGIVFGGSGQGEAIAANKVNGIRAIVYYGSNIEIVKLSRQHNDSNVLSIGAKFLTEEEAETAVEVWLNEKFDAGRHKNRINKISKYESE